MSTELWRAAARILLGVVLLGAVLGAGLWMGSSSVHEQWRTDAEPRSAAEVARAASNAAAYGQRAAEVIQAAQAVVADNAALQGQADQLQQELRNARSSLLARNPSGPVVGRYPPGLAPPSDRLARPYPDAASAAPGDTGGPVGCSAAEPGDPVLSARAVRLWNDALGASPARADAAAAHPASPDGSASAAGAIDTDPDGAGGITLSDAWANHITNATSCAQDRGRLLRLQGWLRGLSSTNP